ncbi:cytochrome-c peroxidase [Marinospirillum insulare]|uniref:Methylamine utilization protein MauG n=1 Tax=Marinospirillum insulare TaxID=217169 RepID=A0ABQ5ZVD6_9GAMM|nr:cytochrome c peroxidase [Marinospirillum insulare]GLR64131.1 methylamine utilization protein MauG [Marinospirillum insulare]
MRNKCIFALASLAFSLPLAASSAVVEKEQLGQALFFDTALSKNHTQSCATCHQAGQAFIDGRGKGVAAAVSLGDDGHSLGDRNAPTVTYTAAIPPFHLKTSGTYAGGLFLDGRAATLADQAEGPPLNPIEMGMTSAAEVVARLKLNPSYVQSFKQLYGEAVFADAETAYKAMADAIAAFERTELFNPYDSKYDRELRGEYTFTDEEELGRTLFFSQQFTNCNQCHQLETTPNRAGEVFTNFEYHNIGVPENKALRAMNGVKVLDEGLFQHPDVNDPAQRGKFRTSTLRNVAVTGPYMHNGVFKDLRTVVLFYNKFNSKAAKRQINPETGEPWGDPEIPENISMDLLTLGPALDDRRVDALVAFMKTLTDKRYEFLLETDQ